jgi:hypothetical protein
MSIHFSECALHVYLLNQQIYTDQKEVAEWQT